MLKKIDNVLRALWFLFWPVLTAILLFFAAWDLFIWLDDEMGALWLNIACLCAVITCSGWIVNFIISIVKDIMKAIKNKRNNK